MVTGKSLGFGWRAKSAEEKRVTMIVVGVGVVVGVVAEVMMYVLAG